jgi:transcription elongation factor Elf1
MILYIYHLELDEIIEKMLVNNYGKNFQCTNCDFVTHVKQRMKCHIEAKHVNTGGVVCPICRYVCPTRKALQTHNSRYHKF